MSKTKSKNHSELEHLRGLIKHLKSENRQLRRRLKEIDKKVHFFEDVVDEIVEEVDVKNACKACGKGTILEYDLKYVILEKCNLCDYQNKKRINRKAGE